MGALVNLWTPERSHNWSIQDAGSHPVVTPVSWKTRRPLPKPEPFPGNSPANIVLLPPDSRFADLRRLYRLIHLRYRHFRPRRMQVPCPPSSRPRKLSDARRAQGLILAGTVGFRLKVRTAIPTHLCALRHRGWPDPRAARTSQAPQLGGGWSDAI